MYRFNKETIKENKVVCNKMDKAYEKCCGCSHGEGSDGKGHFPIGTCNIVTNKCSRVLTDAYGIITQCL